MADTSMRVTNWPDSGSPARVAFEMVKWLRETVDVEGKSKEERRELFLDLYAECIHAANGFRSVKKK